MKRPTRLRRFLSRHAYYLIIIALLAAIVIHEYTHPRRVAPSTANFATPRPAYANIPVTVPDAATTLDQYLRNLSDQSHIPIHLVTIDPGSGAPRDLASQPITPSATGSMSLLDALQAIYRQPKPPVTASLEPSQILVGTPDDLYSSQRAVDIVYPIDDLLAVSDPWTSAPTGEDFVQSLIDLIENLVQPDAWRDKGGQIGSIRWVNNNLIITATPDMHYKIQLLLAQLRTHPQ